MSEHFKAIAFDMDGTLLNSKKEISEYTLDMINKAFDEGKEVVLSTGRCIAELRDYFKVIPRLRFAICSSGAIVYDVKEEKIIYSNCIPPDKVNAVLEESKKEDLMVHILDIESIVDEDKVKKMDYYGMGVYQSMYEKVTTKVSDIYEYYGFHPNPVPKLNLYHATASGRMRTRKRLENLGLVLVDAEKTALECSAPGVTKGTGLKKLCEHIGIDVKDVIAVGDADNDIDLLKTAGFAVAMGNANDNLKAVADVVVKDCDHDGCGEAVFKYLLD